MDVGWPERPKRPKGKCVQFTSSQTHICLIGSLAIWQAGSALTTLAEQAGNYSTFSISSEIWILSSWRLKIGNELFDLDLKLTNVWYMSLSLLESAWREQCPWFLICYRLITTPPRPSFPGQRTVDWPLLQCLCIMWLTGWARIFFIIYIEITFNMKWRWDQ